jgi:hypothetical protein
MHGKPLYIFSGCRLNVEGQEVILIYTPFSHKPESERALIERVLARLKQKQPVILVYVKFDETTLRVIDPPEWKEAIESRALPGSILDPNSVLKDLPIYEEDLLPASSQTP